MPAPVQQSNAQCAPRSVRRRIAAAQTADTPHVSEIPEGALRTVTPSPTKGKERPMLAIFAAYIMLICGATFACRKGWL